MELKSLQDWVIAKYLRSAPDVVDDSSIGGSTREYQVRVDPDKLISYGLSLAQIEQQPSPTRTQTPAEASSSKVRSRSEMSGRSSLATNVADIAKTVLKTQNGTPVRIKDIAEVTQGPKIRLGQIGKPSIAATA